MEKEKTKETPSLSSENETSASVKHDYTAMEIAEACLTQYYTILKASPADIYMFLNKDIARKIMFSNIKEWNPDLSTIHAQNSILNSVVVGVNGILTDTDDVTRNFAATFVLKQVASGSYYVHNHFLHFIDVNNISESSPCLDADATPLTAQQANEKANGSSLETAQDPKKDQTDKSTSKGRNSLPRDPKRKVEPSAWQPAKKMLEISKGISYASTVEKEVSVASASQASPSAVASKPSILGTPKSFFRGAPISVNVLGPKSSILGPYKSPVLGTPRISVSLKPSILGPYKSPVLDAPKLSVNVLGTPKSSILGTPKSSILGAPTSSLLPVKASPLPYNSHPENMSDVKAIRVKDLPPKVIQESLLEVVKKFGAANRRHPD